MSECGTPAQSRTLWGRLREYLDWRANPVLVKDLRLWMRGRLFIVLYFIMILLIVMGAALFTYAARETDASGQWLWGVLFGGVLAICGAVIPNMIYERFRSELKNRATELAMLSELSAARIVRGKLMSGWCASLLVMAAAAPAFSTAYLLGGIDYKVALYFIAWMVWTAVTMPTIQLMITTLGIHVGFRLFAILAFLAQFGGAIGAAAGFYEMFIEDNDLSQPVVWEVSALFYFGGLALAYFFYQVAISRLRGDNEDREFGPRLSLLLTALITSVVLAAVVLYEGHRSPDLGQACLVAAVLFSYVFGIGFLFITRTTDTLHLSLCQNWPRLGLRRLLFYPGNRRLCAYFLAGNLVSFLLILLAGVFWRGPISDREWYVVSSMALLPFVAVGLGLIAHDIVVMPFCARRGWKPTAIISILGTNIALGLVAATGAVVCWADTGWRSLQPHFMAISPIGFALNMANYSASESFKEASAIVLMLEAAMIAVFLAVIAGSIWNDGRKHHVSGIGKYKIGSESDVAGGAGDGA